MCIMKVFNQISNAAGIFFVVNTTIDYCFLGLSATKIINLSGEGGGANLI